MYNAARSKTPRRQECLYIGHQAGPYPTPALLQLQNPRAHLRQARTAAPSQTHQRLQLLHAVAQAVAAPIPASSASTQSQTLQPPREGLSQLPAPPQLFRQLPATATPTRATRAALPSRAHSSSSNRRYVRNGSRHRSNDAVASVAQPTPHR